MPADIYIFENIYARIILIHDGNEWAQFYRRERIDDSNSEQAEPSDEPTSPPPNAAPAA